jgi:hypothetical protein
MKSSLTLAVFLIACCACAYSQELTEGFVVKTSGDTIRGLIRERFEWSKVKSIEVGDSLRAGTMSIPMTEVDNFFLSNHNSYYLRRTLEIDKKPIETSRLEESPLNDFHTETIVIRQLEEGKVNLYTYVDENGKQHFFVQPGKKKSITVLLYIRYYIPGGSQIIEHTPYIGTLRNLLTDCYKVRISKNLAYNERALRRVIAQYNSCFSTTTNTTAVVSGGTQGSIAIDVFAGGGVAFENFRGGKLGADLYYADPNGADFKTTTAAFYGVNFHYLAPRSTRLIAGLRFGYFKTGTSIASDERVLTRYDLWMDFSAITTALSLKYIANPDQKFKFYVSASIGPLFLLKATSTFTVTDLALNTTTDGIDFASYKKSGLAYSAGLGTSLDRISLEVSVLQNLFTVKEVSGVADNAGQAVVTNLVASLGFRLTKK